MMVPRLIKLNCCALNRWIQINVFDTPCITLKMKCDGYFHTCFSIKPPKLVLLFFTFFRVLVLTAGFFILSCDLDPSTQLTIGSTLIFVQRHAYSLSDFLVANSCGNGTYVFEISRMCVSRLEICNISGVECGKIEFFKKPVVFL
jgi:hypothetical protein